MGRPPEGPVRSLQFHEVVNDSVDGMPVGVTWCPLCGSAAVYERRYRDRTLTVGVSGKLADDNLVIYDRETDSEWKKSSGECIAGAGDSPSVRPASVLPWGRFRDAAPDGVVLERPGGVGEAASDADDPAPIDYDGSPYGDYFESDKFGLDAHRGGDSRDWDVDDVDPKAAVLGVGAGDEAVGFSLPAVRDAGGVVRTAVGGRGVVVFATAEARSRVSFSTTAAVHTDMSTTIETPDAGEACEYCGSAVFDHDPVCVRDCTDDCGSPAYFCNYACLSSYVDEEQLTVGDACKWSPE